MGYAISLKRNPSSNMGLLIFYRYVSLALSSIFFLMDPQSVLGFKMGVIASLCIAAWIITDLQTRYAANSSIMKLTVIAEMVGVTLLLIPTGGISSAFIWYALNPVLVAAMFLSSLFCWGILAFFLSSATFIAYLNTGNLAPIFEGQSYFYLVCLLTVILTRLFTGLTRELLHVNEKLTETNEKYQDTLEQVMSLYHLMDKFSSAMDVRKLMNEITASIVKSTKSKNAFFWLTDFNQQHSHFAIADNDHHIENKLKEKWPEIRGKRVPFVMELNGAFFGMKVIKTSYNICVVGVEMENNNVYPGNQPFEFLCELAEIMLEKLHMDEMMDEMIVVEEQNRIANEIHDSVSQRLFGLVCSLHSLKVKGGSMSSRELEEEYEFLSKTANSTIKELRSVVYRLSSVKKGETPFLVCLQKYLEEFARLNDIRIDYQMTGEEGFISEKVKQTLYRIISEACGNSVRHGKCKQIELKLTITERKAELSIYDDGIGFNPRQLTEKKTPGIGLYNMHAMVNSFAGTISIDGQQGVGTDIHIEIPSAVIPIF
ncbi:sensor histidine kinase [Sporosarcina luteola]|nr:ATP-binding protein [Sporosarcina luteola]